MKVALTGASGFIGKYLQKLFEDTVIIAREDTEEIILKKLQDVDIVINLAGSPIMKRWSRSYKNLLLSSRVQTTKKIVLAINKSNVKHFISTSAVGFYPNSIACDENFTTPGNDFLGELTQKWEEQALQCNKPTSIIRFGIILSQDGGALLEMLTPFKLGLGGNISNGSMMMSWIDIEDLMGMYLYIIENKLTGIFNATSPSPVSNKEFTKTLGKILHRPTFLPLPEFILKIIFGEGSTVLTSSKEIYPRAISNAGYKFKYQTIQESLEHLLKSQNT